ncbi:toll/interleukin-1 receptor domain-containing protein [Longimicrobium sp.]|uniref:toll/interleukin-1 receptor domain-containing protein n=1 Tax=Longimicrobium sp. TaxID=2029185 RepID=UPI002E2EEA14|nr:toll/interleukin-1 receptor domain-containing protein [Longimicrobium sp.]HEX6038009.1 toll/interleukin-1 receptor domain-containing protein [Longimicrobium sp.]
MSHPKVFVSYSWDNEQHIAWVKDFAARLRGDGVDVTLDQWHLVEGDQLAYFMEAAIRDNQHVLVICTPRYKVKADTRQGGVGYEGDIITAQRLSDIHTRKFIPILRAGTWEESLPTGLGRPLGIDFRGDPPDEGAYQRLLGRLHGQREDAPPLGPIPRQRNHTLDDVPSSRTGSRDGPPGGTAFRHSDEVSSPRGFASRLAGWFSRSLTTNPTTPRQQQLAKNVVDEVVIRINLTRNAMARDITEMQRLSRDLEAAEAGLRDSVRRIELALVQHRHDLASGFVPLRLEQEHKLLLLKQARARATALKELHQRQLVFLQQSLPVARAELSTLLDTDGVLERLPSPDPSEYEHQTERYGAFLDKWRGLLADERTAGDADLVQHEALREFRASPDGLRLAQLHVRDESLAQATFKDHQDRLLEERA